MSENPHPQAAEMAKAAKDEATSLDTMIPVPKTIKVGDRELEIRQIKVKSLPALMAAIRPITSVVRMLYDAVTTTKKLDPAMLMDLVLLYTDDLITMMAVLMQVPREWLDEQEIDELVVGSVPFIEIHIDFFVQKVLPLLSVAAQAAKGAQSNAQSTKATTTPTPSSN